MVSTSTVRLEGASSGCCEGSDDMVERWENEERIHTDSFVPSTVRSTRCSKGFVEWKWSRCWEKDGGKVTATRRGNTKWP